jgi:hypothetical protein
MTVNLISIHGLALILAIAQPSILRSLNRDLSNRNQRGFKGVVVTRSLSRHALLL